MHSQHFLQLPYQRNLPIQIRALQAIQYAGHLLFLCGDQLCCRDDLMTQSDDRAGRVAVAALFAPVVNLPGNSLQRVDKWLQLLASLGFRSIVFGSSLFVGIKGLRVGSRNE